MGRRPALRGAAGIVGGDSVLGIAAVALLTLGTALPARVFSTTQLVAAALLIALGALLALRPTAISDSIGRMHRPARTFFLLTSLTPTALGSWIAMLAAMPFAADTTQLASVHRWGVGGLDPVAPNVGVRCRCNGGQTDRTRPDSALTGWWGWHGVGRVWTVDTTDRLTNRTWPKTGTTPA